MKYFKSSTKQTDIDRRITAIGCQNGWINVFVVDSIKNGKNRKNLIYFLYYLIFLFNIDIFNIKMYFIRFNNNFYHFFYALNKGV